MADEANSIREIAKSLVMTTPKPEEPKPARPAPTEATELPEDQPGAQIEDGADEGQPDTDDAGEGYQAADEGGEGGDEGDGDRGEVYRVKVDGETREVSLSELIASYSGEGAIAKRLQEATEARNEAQRARETAVEQEREAARATIQQETEALRQQAQNLAAVYQHYGAQLLQPEVEMPDPSLRQTDPVGWLTQMEAYRQDQSRLQSQQAHMQEVVEQAAQLERQQRAEAAKIEVQKMIEEVPAMANPEYRRAQVGRVMEIGKAVGFSEQEVRLYASDRRVVYLAMLAAQGAEAIMKSRSGGKPTVTPKAKTPAPTNVVRNTNGRFKAREAHLEQARSTGSVADVAKTLIVRRK